MHHLDVSNIVDVSEVYSASVFRTLKIEAAYASETPAILPTSTSCKERSNNGVKINMGFLADILLYPYYRSVSRNKLIHTHLDGHTILFNLTKIKNKNM
jgi:hypothetical protein